MGIQELYNPETQAYEYNPSAMGSIKQKEYEDFLKVNKATYDAYAGYIDQVNQHRKDWIGDSADTVQVGEYKQPSYEEWKSGYSLSEAYPEFAPLRDMSWTKTGMYSHDTGGWKDYGNTFKSGSSQARGASYQPQYALDYNEAYIDQWAADNPELWQQKKDAWKEQRRAANKALWEQEAAASAAEEQTLADRQAEYERINIGAPRTGSFLSGYNTSRGSVPPAASREITIGSGPEADVITYDPSGYILIPDSPTGRADGGPSDGRGMLSNNAIGYTGPFTPDEAGRAAGRPQTGGTTPMPNNPMPTRYEPTKPVFGRADGGPNDQRGMFGGGASGWDERVRRAREQAERPNAVSRMFRGMFPDD